MRETAAKVTELEKIVEEIDPVHAKWQQENAGAKSLVAAKSKEKETQQDKVAEDDKATTEQREECAHLKKQMDGELSEAVPFWDQAVELLKKLKAEKVREVKSMAKPPPGVILTMEAVCVAFGSPPKKATKGTERTQIVSPMNPAYDYWEPARTDLLKDPKKLIDDLLNFDKGKIRPETVKKITLNLEREEFDPPSIPKFSLASEAFAMWVKAVHKYYVVNQLVEPKKREIVAAQEALQELEKLQHALDTPEADYARGVASQQNVKNEIEDCQVKIERAQKIIDAMEDPEQWKQQANNEADVTWPSLVAAALVVYMGPFQPALRAALEGRAMELIESQEAHVVQKYLGDLAKIEHWHVSGLVGISTFTDNGIILDTTRRWPLLIDPRQQAIRYIKELGKVAPEGLEVFRQNATNFLRTLELGIQFGKWILVEYVPEELHQQLEPIFLSNRHSRSSTVKLGEKIVTWTSSFRLFLSTNLPNPHYGPDVCWNVQIVDN